LRQIYFLKCYVFYPGWRIVIDHLMNAVQALPTA